MEPTFRCGTRKAIDELAEELNLRNDLTMQDWSYEVANSNDIDKYISHYGSTKDDDKKFVLMEIIIQAAEEQNTEQLFKKYCETIEPILEINFKLHEFTIYYWACFDNENLEDCWKITPLFRRIWEDQKRTKKNRIVTKKMTEKQKILYNAIDEILWKDWDPIGVNDIEEVRNEYQDYTPHIFSLTIQGADKVKIAKHLYEIETVNMGMTGNKIHCEQIAEKILKLIE